MVSRPGQSYIYGPATGYFNLQVAFEYANTSYLTVFIDIYTQCMCMYRYMISFMNASAPYSNRLNSSLFNASSSGLSQHQDGKINPD